MNGCENVGQSRAGDRFAVDPGGRTGGRPIAHAHDRRGNIYVIPGTGSVLWW